MSLEKNLPEAQNEEEDKSTSENQQARQQFSTPRPTQPDVHSGKVGDVQKPRQAVWRGRKRQARIPQPQAAEFYVKEEPCPQE